MTQDKTEIEKLAEEFSLKWRITELDSIDSPYRVTLRPGHVMDLRHRIEAGFKAGFTTAESKLQAKVQELESELSALKAENEKLKEFERKRWESAVGTLGITPPKPEEV